MEYGQAFDRGRTFEEFVEGAVANRELWQPLSQRARLVTEAAGRLVALPGQWRLLVLAEDWCGDAVNILPVIARLVDAVDNVELRIVGREEHPGLMSRHLTNGSRSIPVVILLDDGGRPSGWWGPRPAALQKWYEHHGRALPQEERYRELRRWYARDRGVSIASEIADLIWCGAVAAHPSYSGTVPCAA